MTKKDNTFFNKIAVLRAERGLHRRQLAGAIGVNEQTIGFLEQDDCNPSLEPPLRVANFFELPVTAIWSRQPFERMSAQLQGKWRPS